MTMRLSIVLFVSWFFVHASGEATLGPCLCTGREFACSGSVGPVIRPQDVCTDAPNLTVATLNNLALNDIPDGLQAFEEVSANHNNLTSLPNASLLNTRLKVLKLKFNNINESSDGLKALSSLEELRLDNNELTSLDFLPQPCNLRILSLLNNEILSFEGLQACNKLTHLYITSGNTPYLDEEIFAQLNNLEELWLNDQNITFIPDGLFQHMKKLKILRLSGNSNIVLSERTFEGLSNLETLDLSICGLTSLPPRMFASTPRLEEIDLSLNDLRSLLPDTFSGLHWLTQLNLGRNNLTDVPALEACCAHVERVVLLGNVIVEPSEARLRGALTGNAAGVEVDLTQNPVRAGALRWALAASDVQTFVACPCNCGGVRIGAAQASFCVYNPCGGPGEPADWRAAAADDGA